MKLLNLFLMVGIGSGIGLGVAVVGYQTGFFGSGTSGSGLMNRAPDTNMTGVSTPYQPGGPLEGEMPMQSTGPVVGSPLEGGSPLQSVGPDQAAGPLQNGGPMANTCPMAGTGPVPFTGPITGMIPWSPSLPPGTVVTVPVTLLSEPGLDPMLRKLIEQAVENTPVQPGNLPPATVTVQIPAPSTPPASPPTFGPPTVSPPPVFNTPGPRQASPT